MALKAIRGDTYTVRATFVDADGSAVDLTGGTVFFTANANNNPSDDTGAIVQKDITSFTAPTTGIQDITLTAAEMDVDPGTYFFDVQFKSSGGVVISNPRDKLEIEADVSRRTS